MKNVSRRRFLKNAGEAGLAVAASSALGRFSVAQGAQTTRVVIDSERQICCDQPALVRVVSGAAGARDL